MELRRLFVDRWIPLAQADQAVVQGPVVERMRRVLRLQPGDRVDLIPGDGAVYRVRLLAYRDRHDARVEVLERFEPMTEAPVRLTLAIAPLKRDDLDEVVFRATELGLTRMIPVLTRRTVVRWEDARWQAKRSRWQRLAAEALESSGRTRLPEFTEPIPFPSLFSRLPDHAVILWLLEPRVDRETVPLWDWVARARRSGSTEELVVLVGPEGGWEREELALKDERVQPITLGHRTLRAGTGALAALVLLQPLLHTEMSGGDARREIFGPQDREGATENY